MKVSIIVPIYNVEAYLDRCIESLINQTYKNLEIILIDDGSPDNCGQICEEYAKKDKRIKVIHKENGGQASARNVGLDHMTGEYVLFVDSDDFIAPNMLEKMMNKALNNDIVYCNAYYYTDKITGMFNLNFQFTIPNDTNQLILSNTAPFCKLYHKHLWDSIRFPEGIIYEDYAILPYLHSKCEKICYIDESYYYYQIREGSTMNQSAFTKKFYDILTASDILRNNFNDSSHQEEVEFIIFLHLIILTYERLKDYQEATPIIDKGIAFIKEYYPNWQQNKYFNMFNYKYKTYCKLVFKKKNVLLRLSHKLMKKKGM